MITLLGSARRACSGPTRRETLKAGALTLLGQFFQTPSLSALESLTSSPTQKARAKSVVLIYLQGGAPTQDMYDMKPLAPGGVGGEVLRLGLLGDAKGISRARKAHAAENAHEIGELQHSAG